MTLFWKQSTNKHPV